MIRLSTGCSFPPPDFLRWLVLHYPGQVWVIGNEPDVIWQDSLTAEEYARQYHDAYQIIKTTDPSAMVATAGISRLRLYAWPTWIKCWLPTSPITTNRCR